MTDLHVAVAACIASKANNKEFSLHYFPEKDLWRAQIGNPCPAVSLGETQGEYSADGSTPLEAVNGLFAQIEAPDLNEPLAKDH